MCSQIEAHAQGRLKLTDHLSYSRGAQLISQGTEQRSRIRCGVVGFACPRPDRGIQ